MNSISVVSLTITGADQESAAFELMNHGALGTVDVGNGCTIVYVPPEYDRELVNGVLLDYGCMLSRVAEEEIDPDIAIQQSQSWFPLHFGSFSVVPALQYEHSEESAVSENTIRILPGAGFGTGHHPTTQMLLSLLSQCAPPSRAPLIEGSLRASGKPPLCWDVGCGSGILGIAFERITGGSSIGWEYDGMAVANARDNIRMNHSKMLIHECEFRKGAAFSPLDAPTPDVVMANLYGSLHQKLEPLYAEVLPPGVPLLLSGVMSSEFDDLSRSFSGAQWHRDVVMALDGWLAFVFVRQFARQG